MLQGGAASRIAAARYKTPLLVRLLGKFVLEVLPAALASVIGGLLLANYQFAHAPVVTAAQSSTPASAEMVRLVREEHAMIRDFLLAQSAAEKSRIAAADAADPSAAADAELAAAALRRAPPAKQVPVLLAQHGKPTVAASAAAEVAPQGPLVIAQANDVAPPVSPAASAPPPVASDHPSLVTTTLAIPGHVVGAALHAVSVIGGIPSWIGNRLGSTPS